MHANSSIPCNRCDDLATMRLGSELLCEICYAIELCPFMLLRYDTGEFHGWYVVDRATGRVVVPQLFDGLLEAVRAMNKAAEERANKHKATFN